MLLLHNLQANVPYSEWFEVKAVQNYHKSLSLEDFMTQLASLHWPVGQRAGYCYRYQFSNVKLTSIL